MIHRLDIRMNKAGRNTKYTKIWRIDNSMERINISLLS